MKKLRVGVWLIENYQPQAGGGYSYYTELVRRIEKYPFKNAEVVFLSHRHLSWTPYQENRATKLINILARKLRLSSREKTLQKRQSDNELRLIDELNQKVDVIYYPTPMCVFPKFPYIYTLFDLGHLTGFAFPETTMNGAFESRKQHHDAFPHKALMIFSESQAGKRDAVNYLGISEERIKVVPLFPSEVVNDSVLPEQPKAIAKDQFFIHYPAQYWAHKNHFNLLIALKSVMIRFPDIRLVLTGADKGNKSYIEKIVTELAVAANVIDLGFVSLEELKWLYLNSQGLIMPTLLGPTNMPLLEAAALGCPVACSKLEGHLEQLGDYGYYFDPKNPDEMAKAICTMICDKQNGIQKPYESGFNIENALIAIDDAFSELRNVRFCWGPVV